ncbi:hypothetical protein ANCCEY_05757 [Ancylostoma ceylanicum]|uniref:Spectrin repeat-containing domain protein n=1 Tax=Ancylostoma ceylanicum TaxID=53326 RepID=A0A0D6LYJ9_9BILA|nr:hypothetical protein ANCCEY_05757 [Ancylostoma ceylanicum]
MEVKKVCRELGGEGGESVSSLTEQCDQAKDLVDEVTKLCMNRTEVLERALALSQHLTIEFDRLTTWLDQIDDELRTAPELTTATPLPQLRKQREHNAVCLDLAAAILAYVPIVEQFRSDVSALQDICVHEDGVKLGELADEIIAKWTVINAQVEAVHDGWATITKLFADKNRDLIAAMEDAMAFHTDMASLLAWLDDAETRLAKLPATESLKVERMLLQMGRLSEAADQLIAWMRKTRGTLDELSVAAPTLRQLEIQRCQLTVVSNDVHAHESRCAKAEAEKVGREAEQWMVWLEDVESQLATTKPTGGLPETAEIQLDDFRVLRSEVDTIAQNKPALEAYIDDANNNLCDGENNGQTWIGRNHALIRNKWAKVKVGLSSIHERCARCRPMLSHKLHLEDGMEEMCAGGL